MSKYQPLSDRLVGHDGDEWRASLAEIEAMLGFPLPKAAQHAAWWSGDKPRAWLDHGWRADGFDKATGQVSFHRQDVPAIQTIEVMTRETSSATSRHRALGATALIGAGVAVAAGIGMVAARLLRRR